MKHYHSSVQAFPLYFPSLLDLESIRYYQHFIFTATKTKLIVVLKTNVFTFPVFCF